jgi:isocitrate dehydrogenase kinase/phosphatase
VVLEEDKLILKHLYIERRLVPLDVWLEGADEADMARVIDDYGRAIEELATANIFPGDLLLKNFGLTRWGRVVFYDYDEISRLTEVSFRRLPTARDDAEEWSAEPWFQVGPQDVFPEQFPQFIFRAGRQRELFLERHGALADPDHWRDKQQQIRAGVLEPFFPYPESRRLAVRYGQGR